MPSMETSSTRVSSTTGSSAAAWDSLVGDMRILLTTVARGAADAN